MDAAETSGQPGQPEAAQQERSRDFERFLTFIDAIVAIAITLLVLPLVDIAGQLKAHESVWKLLDAHSSQIWAFLLSFFVIANLWMIQHRIVRNVIAANDNLTRLLLLWTASIVVLPFPTALVAGKNGAGDQAPTKLLYVGTMAAGSVLLGLVCLVISRHDELRDSPDLPHTAAVFGTAGTFVVALAVMLLLPGTSYWPLLLLRISNRVVWLGKVVARLVGRVGG